MAVLYITEYADVAHTSAKVVQAGAEPALAEQNLAIGGTSVPSAAFNANTRLVRVHTDVVCSVKFGPPTPVAVATEKRMAANSTEFFGVKPGDMVAVITNT